MKGYSQDRCLECYALKDQECVSYLGTGIWRRVYAYPGTHYVEV